MKKLMTLISCSLFAVSAFAQEGKQYNTNDSDSITGKGTGQTYCIYKKENGKMCVKKQGKEITTNVSLSDGSTLKPDGTVTKADGTTKVLQEGECINKNGTVKPEKNKDKNKNSGY